MTDASGKPATGLKLMATVAMTSMDTGTERPKAVEGKDGHYTVPVKFSMKGPWRVTVMNDGKADKISAVNTSLDLNVDGKTKWTQPKSASGMKMASGDHADMKGMKMPASANGYAKDAKTTPADHSDVKGTVAVVGDHGEVKGIAVVPGDQGDVKSIAVISADQGDEGHPFDQIVDPLVGRQEERVGRVEEPEHQRYQSGTHGLAESAGGRDDAAGAATALAGHGTHHQAIVGCGKDAESRAAQDQPPHDIDAGWSGRQQGRQNQA